MKHKIFGQQIQVYLVSLLLIFNPIVSTIASTIVIAEEQNPKQQNAEFIDYLIEEQDRYKTLFDQEALLDVLDYDTDKIIDFVSNKIVYQAYDGILRGAKGTLIGRSGNSHDQAITLTEMLKDAGLEAQILVGKLTAEQASELNLTIASPQFIDLKNTFASSKSNIVKKIYANVDKLKNNNGESISEIMKETDALAQKIFQQIPEEQINKGKQAFNKSVQKSAISYRWVRYRLTKSKEWTEVHPAYAEAKKWNLIPNSIEKDTINPEDLQQFSVQVWIENSAGEKHSISGLWKKPAANLLDHTLSIEFGSDALMRSDLWNKKDEMLKQSHFFYIQIDGNLPKEGKVFDLNGNIYAGDSISGLNSVFSTINQKTQMAVDALGGLSFNTDDQKVKSNKQLTKVWLEFTLEKPNAESKIIKRVIFEGEALSDTSNTAMKILQRWDIDIATTSPMKQYYQSVKSEQVVKAIEGAEKFQKYFENKPNAKQEEIVELYGLAMGNPNSGLLTHKRSIFDYFKAQKSTVSYLSEPNILAVRHGLDYSNKKWSIYEMTDIISNQRWSFNKLNSAVITPMIKESIRYGVWQTRMESARLVEADSTIHSGSAFTRLAQTEAYSDKMLDATANLQLYDKSQSAWWNVDLQTGSTIGMTDLGYGIGGAELTEATLLQYIAWGITGAFTIVASAVCIDGGGGVICCIGSNLAVAVSGLVLGWYLGVLSIFSSVALSTIGIGVDLASTYIPINCK